MPGQREATRVIPRGLQAASVWWPPSQQEWLTTLPAQVATYEHLWDLRVGPAFSPGGNTAFVAPATRADGSAAIFKLAPPQPALLHEEAALHLYDGEGAVRLYASDPAHRALLVEVCLPGTSLAAAPLAPREKIRHAAPLLRRLWRPVPAGHPFALLESVAGQMALQVEACLPTAPPAWDRGLLHLGVALLRTLPQEATRVVLVHRDYHLGNVLAAQREPWLVIDPQPLVGDPTFDAVQLVVERGGILAASHPLRVLRAHLHLVAGELGLDAQRLVAWSVARSVAWATDSLAVGSPSWGTEAIQMAGLLRQVFEG